MRSERSAPHAGVDDCWNRIGVRGDGTCPELTEYVHCRNCPVYSRAAMAQLDVAVPADYLEGWTRHIAAERTVVERDTSSCLVFRVGVEWLALAIGNLKEIAAARMMQPMPHRRSGIVLGVTNVRGELLACVSLERLLGLEPVAQHALRGHAWSARLIVAEHEGARTVFPADEVFGIVRFHANELTNAPATTAKSSASYVRALLPWQGRSVGVIDERLLFHSIDRSLSSAAAI